MDVLATDAKPNASDLAKAGDYLVPVIRNRTLSGVSYDGTPFAPYSPAYASRKGGSTVTLFSQGDKNQGHMLDAVTHQETDNTLDVGIFGNDKLATLAQVHQEGATIRTRLGWGMEGFKRHPGRRRTRGKDFSTIPARRWLGASEQDIARMNEIIMESMAERLRRNGGW